VSRRSVTHTVISSATREVVIGFDRPFTIIGERINPTGRKLLAEEMKAGDFSRVERDAVAQVEAGAHMLDVNAGIPLADEPAILARTVRLVQALVDVPLSIDSSIVEALEAGLAAYVGKPLVNSVTGEEERLERVLPLIRKYGAAVVAISNDDTGISEDPDVRFEVARRIVERAADHGIPREDVIVDPLVMPIGAMATAGQQVFRLVRRLREELGVNTTCGASNVSFGMPDRERINAAFLPMAIASGLTSAITNPLAAEVRAAIMAADVLMGNDQDAGRWIRAHRAAAAAPAVAATLASSRGLRAPAASAAAAAAATGPATLSVIEGGGADARPAGSRPRINRRALAAASAMRDAAGRGRAIGGSGTDSGNGSGG
jgi:5-methyltetrahydrofolate--homocysteine methyltransferase